MQASLWLGNPNYSSWSLRGWLICHLAGLEPAIHWVSFSDTEWKNQLPSPGLVPVVKLDDDWVWDSLAMAEELNSRFPEAMLLPSEPSQRAYARVLMAEMHSGFSALRNQCPMNIRARTDDFLLSEETLADIYRIQDLLEHALNEYAGPYLFGEHMNAVDAFFAPVVYRLQTYAPPAHSRFADYCNHMLASKPLKMWNAWAEKDEHLPRYDSLIES